VRDRLLNRRGRYLDLDFVLPEKAVETAQAIARKYKAGFVEVMRTHCAAGSAGPGCSVRIGADRVQNELLAQ